MRMYTRKIQASVTEEQREELEVFAKNNHTSMSEVIRKSLDFVIVDSTDRMQEQFQRTLRTKQQIFSSALKNMKNNRIVSLQKKRKAQKIVQEKVA